VSTGKVVVHRLGIPLDALPFVVRRPDASGIIKILIASTFREKKGIPYALRPSNACTDDTHGLQVTLIGDSGGKAGDAEEKREILALVEQLNPL